MESIAAIILAAGASTRFGRPKQLLDWHGVPLLAHVADRALAAGLHPAIVVLGHQAEDAHAALGSRPVRPATNWRWREGLATSVQAGLAALPPDTEAAILMQCDQPLVTEELLRALAARHRETGAAIVHPIYQGQRGTPALFARSLFAELAAISGDVGGRVVIARHPDQVATVDVSDPDILSDADTPAEYKRLHRSAGAQEGKPSLSDVTHLIIDMDGVLWRGDEPVDGLEAFFATLNQRGIDFVLATNNSSRLPEQYQAKLARFGVDVPVESILTSAQVAAAYLSTVAPRGARVYAIGEEGVRRALGEQGFVLAEEDADYVVVGWDRDLTWRKLETAALLIHRGAGFVGTNPDTNYPTERGPVPGNGAQLAALETTTGEAATITGKPERWMYEEALERMDARPQTTAVIGDRLDTDIAGAVDAGLITVLMLSGIARREDLAASAVKPDLVYADLRSLIADWPGRSSS